MESLIKIPDKRYKRSLYIFDSSTATSIGDGFVVRYIHSTDKIVGYRVTSLLLDNLTGAFVNRPTFYLLCDLSRASYSGHINGTPRPVIAFLHNPSSTARVSYTDHGGEDISLDVDTFTSIYFEVRDSQNVVVPNTVRIIFTIEFVHCFE